MRRTTTISMAIVAMLVAGGCESGSKAHSRSKSQPQEQVAQAPEPTAAVNGVTAKAENLPAVIDKHGPSMYYMALRSEVIDWKSDASKRDESQTCVDDSFISWARKLLWKDAVSVSLVVEVKGPQDANFINYPLFEVAKSEKASPPTCFSDVKSKTLTAWHLIQQGAKFEFKKTLTTDKSADVSAFGTLTKAAADIFSLAGGSAWVIKELASPIVTSGSQKIDASLSQNWSSRSTDASTTDIYPIPPQGVTKSPTSGFLFSVPELSVGAGGITANQSIPRVRLTPITIESMFGGGVGKYYEPHRIWGIEVGANRLTIENALRQGITGFTANTGKDQNTVQSLNAFCVLAKASLARFLTPNDELAARYAVLRFATNYPMQAELRLATECLSESEATRLKTLNAEFTFNDLSRVQLDKRDEEVTLRWEPIGNALMRRSSNALRRLTLKPEAFLLRADTADIPLIPAVKLKDDEKEKSQSVGDLAIRRLFEAGAFGISCYRAIKDQDLSAIAAVAVLGEKTLAVVARFSGDRQPATDATRAEDRKLEGLTFMPIDDLKGLYAWREWPGRPCQALAGI